MKNNVIVNTLITLLNGYKNLLQQNAPSNRELRSLNYLIGQVIRQYDIPMSNVHVSGGAASLWNKLTSANMNDYWYKESVVCDNLLGQITCLFYKGSVKVGESAPIHKGDTFCFNDLFHVDHVVPVSIIKQELLNLDVVDYSSVMNVLNKMHLCKILKEEDRKLGRIKDRTSDYQETINTVYNPKNVNIMS